MKGAIALALVLAAAVLVGQQRPSDHIYLPSGRDKPFDVTRHAVPIEEILSGGPPKDGIPALDHPKFVTASDAKFLKDRERVLGVALDGAAKAYPIKILNWHEIVNDEVNGHPITVTW